MSADIVRFGRCETVPEFIRRVAGPKGRASTAAIAARFCWDIREAKRRLDALARAGTVINDGLDPQSHEGIGGRVTMWKLPVAAEVRG